MSLNYKLVIDQSWNHCVKVTITGQRSSGVQYTEFLMPAWSPGSYFMREYAQHVRRFLATTDNGEFIQFEKMSKGLWRLDWKNSELKKSTDNFSVSYEVYCNELSVRASHVDLEHAFIHGPSVFMQVKGLEESKHILEVEFPQNWNKLNTELKDISKKRQHFIYEAKSFDELVDCPLEVGTQSTSGFMVNGVAHNIVNFREPVKFSKTYNDDCKKIVQEICDFWGEVPFDSYTFINHFLPSTYGGLEHRNSTALQFDCFEVVTAKGYVDYLGLVSHEYFHSWNVKRIRPLELGPFDYERENYTRMHWLTEGLTSFVDDLFVLKAGLLDQETYLKNLVKRINSYENTPGRYLDSLEDASFDAWIKLYRPHAASHNATVNYYLKGSLAFFCLNSLLQTQGHSLQEFCIKLWQRYKSNPSVGVTKKEVLTILENIAGVGVRDEFDSYLSTTIDLPIEQSCQRVGLAFERSKEDQIYWGFSWKEKGRNLFVSKVMTDGPAYRAGLNEGDEIIAAEGVRLESSTHKKWIEVQSADYPIEFLVSRKSKLLSLKIVPTTPKIVIKALRVENQSLLTRALSLC